MKRILLLSFLAVLFVAASSLEADACEKRLATMNFVDYVICLKYPVETHVVTTDDGYKLTMFRIQAKNTKITGGKSVLLLWHGLLDSSDSWIMNDENIAPGLVLANKGYDIWFGNSRGNKYSTDHKTLNSKTSAQYWEFSWMQMSEHDLVAAFPYIAQKTNKKITYIGHSQGTTQMFAALANPNGRNPAIINNLEKFAALGPVAYLGNVKSKLMTLIAQTKVLPEVMAIVGKYGIFQPNWATSQVGKALCKYMQWACTLGLALVADVDPSLDNMGRSSIFGGHFPAGTSVDNLFHWKQSVQSGGKFQKYDYGTEKNQKVYGQPTPPRYNPALIKENVALFVGSGDELATTLDASKWHSEMGTTKKALHIYNMGHMTFLIGKTLPYMDDLVKFIGAPSMKSTNLETSNGYNEYGLVAEMLSSYTMWFSNKFSLPQLTEENDDKTDIEMVKYGDGLYNKLDHPIAE